MQSGKVLKGLAPWVAVTAVYFIYAYTKNIETPGSRIFPTLDTFGHAITWMTTPKSTNGQIPILVDTIASVTRLLIALAISLVCAVIGGLAFNLSRLLRDFFFPSIILLAKIPIIALLPLLLVWGGYGDGVRILLIVLGITPVMLLVIFKHLEGDQEILELKLSTLHLPTWQVTFLVKLPMIVKYCIHALQSQLGAAWLFLLVAESFGTNTGLGYRINVFRGRAWMDITILYVICISLIAALLYFILDRIYRHWNWSWK